MERTDEQELEQREKIRDLLTDEIKGLENDYVILARNHGTNENAAMLMVDIKNQIQELENLLRFYKK